MNGADRVTARVSRGHVTPELVRALLPALKLRVPLDLEADVEREGGTLTFAAKVESVAGAVEAHGSGDFTTLRARKFRISAVNVDLGALAEGLPQSSLSLAAEGEGGGRDLRALEGKLSLEMPVGRLEGAAIGPLELRVDASPGRYELTRLRLALPGLDVEGHGEAGPERLALHLGIVADDLGRASRALSALRDLGLPTLAGRGRVEVSLFGTVDAPGVRMTAKVPRLVMGDDSIVGATLFARLPNARKPDSGEAELRVARARLAGRAVQNVAVHADSTARRLALTAQVGGTLPVSLGVAGNWGRARQSFELDRLDLHYPRAGWTLARPALLIFRPGRLAIAGLELSARAQRLRVDFEKRGDRLRGAFAVERLDLGALPTALVRPGLSVAGHLDVRATLEGTTRRPSAAGTVVLRGGAYDRYRDLSLRLDGRYARGRAAGTLAAAGLGTSVNAKFDLPTQWPPRDGKAPLALDLTVRPVDLTALAKAAKVPFARPLGGRVALSLALHGTANAPDARLDASTTRLVVDGQALGTVTLIVAASPTTPLNLALTVQTDDGSGASPPAKGQAGPLVCSGSLKLRTDLELASLSKHLPTARELERARFDLSGDLRGIPLAELSRLLRSPVLSGGSASVRVSAAGTPLAPTGALNVQLVGATGPRFPPTDARLDAAFGAKDVRVALRILRGAKDLAWASGILGLPSRELVDRTALVAAPLTLRAAVGPLRVQRGDLEGSALTGPTTALSAKLTAALSIDGTLNRPSMKAEAELEGVRLGDAPLGNARARMTYVARRAALDVEVRSTKGDALRVKGATSVDLGYAQLVGGIDVGQLPLDVTLSARDFDLAWLSGLSDSVRNVGGALSASLTASGKLGQPWVNGQLEWTHGALGLTGLGNYRDVHVAAHGDPNALWLDDLRLTSGDGSARVTATATRAGDRGYEVKSALALHRFPIYGQGQALAVLSADATLVGAASRDRAQATLKLSDVHAELTDNKQKNLQALARPSDVILMNDGKPLDRAEAQKLAAVTAAMGGEPSAPQPRRDSAAGPPRAKAFEIHLAIDAPRDLWVRGKDASLELGLGPDFRVESVGRLRIYGEVAVRRGRIDVLGRRFDLQAGSSLRFTGSPDAPRLDVSAKYVNETENVTVILTAKGPLDHLAIGVSSPDRPELTEGQLYALIVTGRLQLGGNTAGSVSASGEAASLVGGLVASQLQKTLAKRLPLDVLTLQAGQGLSGSRLEAGTYLTSKLYAGYVGRVGANPALLQNRNAVHLEYQLSRRWSFDGEYGDVGTGTADLMWTNHY